MRRVRITGYRVVPEAFVDDDADGSLTRLQLPPTFVAVKDWPNVVAHAEAALAKLQAEIAKEPT